MASEYASSPEAQPALQIRMGSLAGLDASSWGRISPRTSSQAGGSRKKPVTLIRMVLNNWVNSSGSTSRWSR
jgi:hypothetical protein